MSNYPKPGSSTFVEIFRRATLIKQNDERIIRLLKAGKLVCPYYSPRGQEIIPSALSVSLNDDDYICTIYRGVHDMIAKGFPLPDMWAELAGRVTGTCKGKGGPMHLTYPKKGVMLTTGIVGSSMPIANGLAWGALLDGSKSVTVANFGDGAANSGSFNEALNMAALWKLPVIFLCQNNMYAEHTTYAASTAAERLSIRAQGYGMPGVTINGNDAEEMFGAALTAIERARAGDGPTLIEAMTYRFNGHLLGDPQTYIDEVELEEARKNDPVALLRVKIVNAGFISEQGVAQMEATIEAEIDAAVEFAFASEFPGVAELKRDVYANELA